MDRSSGRLGNTIVCPRCQADLRRSNLEGLGSFPAWIAYESEDGKRYEKAPTQDDIDQALSFRRDMIDAWYPDIPLGADREMYIRCALHLRSISSVADFYTPRNLRALALIWKEIMVLPNERVAALSLSPSPTRHGTAHGCAALMRAEGNDL